MLLGEFYEKYGAEPTYELIDLMVIDELVMSQDEALKFMVDNKIVTKATKYMRCNIGRNHGRTTMYKNDQLNLGGQTGKFGRYVQFINGTGQTKLQIVTHDYEIKDVIKLITQQEAGIA